MKKFDIIKKTYLWIGLALVLMITWFILFTSNTRYSEEFTWGVSIVVNNSLDGEDSSLIQDALNEKWYSDVKILLNAEEDGSTNIKIHTNVSDDAQVAILSNDLTDILVEKDMIDSNDDILSKVTTWPSVGDYMKKSAIQALVAAIIFIAVYMLFSFAGIRHYISPMILAVVTVVTLLFDVIIPAGAYWIWMAINPTIQVDTVFIIAMLTCMWYSINDTIIIFDRIRENFQKQNKKDWSKNDKAIYGKVFENSLWQTMRRSIATSVSTLLVVVAMFIFGSGVIQSFAFTIGIWIIAGSYSSIFIAAPLAYVLSGKMKSEKGKF